MGKVGGGKTTKKEEIGRPKDIIVGGRATDGLGEKRDTRTKTLIRRAYLFIHSVSVDVFMVVHMYMFFFPE